MSLVVELVSASDGQSIPVSRPAFGGVASILKQLPERGLGAIWGASIAEEFSHYASSVGSHGSGSTIVNGRSYSVRYDSARLSRQYARQRYKVESFLWRNVPDVISVRTSKDTTLDFSDVFDFAAAATWQQLVQFIKPKYAATRRVQDGIDDDVSDYLLPFRGMSLSGDIVTRWSVGSPSYEDLILLWVFFHSQSSVRMVILTDVKPRWIESSSVICSSEREYISVKALVSASAGHFRRSQKTVQEALGLWQRGVPPSVRSLIKDGNITQALANSFLRAYAPLVEGDDISALGVAIPSQQAAPLRFRTEAGRIDVVDEKELKPSEPRVVGAAEACISALDDLTSYGGFHNVIPTFLSKSKRISILFSRFVDGSYDDNCVVQLGVELALFEARISNSSDILSDLAMAESASFFPLTQSFLNQFSIWGEYKSKAVDFSLGQDASQAAADVLATTRIRDDVLTNRASARIEDFVTGVLVPEMGGGETGVVLVVENIAAQAAGAIAEVSQAKGEPVSAELAAEIVHDANNAPAAWMIENAADLTVFADSGNISWLKSFLGALGRKR